MMMICCVASLSSIINIGYSFEHRVPYENMIIIIWMMLPLILSGIKACQYDPHILLVPADYFKRQTPDHEQWWKEKSRHFDAVIFFKVSNYVSQDFISRQPLKYINYCILFHQ